MWFSVVIWLQVSFRGLISDRLSLVDIFTLEKEGHILVVDLELVLEAQK